ncbi:hypothetical protein CC1G_04019 [Coprinopsis cinerea okayama7|uniref:Uncharacterized protein n=1 Tax=Coprinopsis cinerea (strain Okayama-7 / 130 / ATCC MYA-4618 / FGSC 9003) TaxID=240176 RepID=A8N8H2_COPC7|nr:hypothetical protein CC1G_04019 [Coprinopsis cinerea okayama7\|eukprot:XP_001831128.2 hypothetical protein CC1G_04019 [Coprinopsis cinerea okayama7\
MQSRTTLLSSVASLKQATTTVDAMSSIAADTAPDSSAQSDTATLAALASSTKAIPVLDDLSDARKYFTRSKVMDTTSLARTRFSDSPQPVGSVAYEDWEDLKEVWARCLEVVDVEDPSETLPLLRGIIHECSRFLQVYDDPSVLFLAPHAVAQNGTPDKSTDPLFGTTKVDAGVGPSEPSPNAAPTIRASTSSTSATHHHSKDLPTAFHSLLGTALFFFGNIIDANPHLALEGEPRTQAFYHLYALDVFEMAERLPARTGSGGIYTGYQEDNDFTGTYSFTSDIIAQAQAAAAAHNDCCGLGAKEDWRMAITWGRTLVSLAEELLEREKLVEELFKPEEVKMAQRPPEDQESYFAYASYGRPPPPPPKAPNPASFLAEDFIMNSGMLGDGYFGGTGGRAMGFNVDGMGGLRVNGSSFMRGVNQPVSLPSAIFPLDEAIPRMNCSSMPSATPGVSSPFASRSLGGVNSSMSPGTSSSSPGSSTLSTVSGRRSRQSPYLPQTPLDDPRKHWKKDSPFMVIRSRMAPVTRRMTLGGGDVNGMPATPELAKYGIDAYDHSSAASGFTLSWWNDDEDEGNGRYPVDSKKRRDDAKKKERKRQGATVDEIMTMAVDQFSRGVLHMPRTGSSGLTGQHSNGAEGGSRRHRHKHHGHKHRHHHGHHHRHHRHGKHAEPLPHPLDGGDQLPQGFSRASHLLTIAIEVLMLAEKLPCAESRYRWASYADNVFAQMRLEESPGTNIVMLNGERMDVDGEPRSHPGSRSGSRTRRAHKSKSRARKDHGDGPSSLSFPLHPLAVHDVSTNPGLFLDSNNNDVILKARGRCALIIGSAVAEERIETFLEEFDEQEDGDEDGDGTPTNSDERQHRESKEERLQKLLKSEDAEEARGRLREAVELLEKARGIWREGVEVRRRERERVKSDVERERRAREVRNVNGKVPNADTTTVTTSPKLGEEERKKVVVKGKGRANGVSSPDRAPPKRRGIAALAAENKKKRKEKERERDAMMVVVDESHDQMDVDVEMGDVSFESQSQPQPHQSTPSLSPPVTSINSNSTTSSQDVEVLSKEEESALKACEMSMEEEDQRLLASFAAEEEEEEEEEREYAKLIAEALVTLANILVVEDGVGVGGDAGDAHARGHGMSEAEMEREELYRKAKEEMRRGGVVEVEGMI